jgi:hypothetical protein
LSGISIVGEICGGCHGEFGGLPVGGCGVVGGLPVGGCGVVGGLPVGGRGVVGGLPVGGRGVVGGLPVGGCGDVGGCEGGFEGGFTGHVPPIWITVPSGQVMVMGGGFEPSGISIVVLPPMQILVPAFGCVPGGHGSLARRCVVGSARMIDAPADAGSAPMPSEPIITPTIAVHHLF